MFLVQYECCHNNYETYDGIITTIQMIDFAYLCNRTKLTEEKNKLKFTLLIQNVKLRK